MRYMAALFDAFRLQGESAVDKALLMVLSTFLMATTSGSVHGWSPILLVLQEEGAYHELCTSNSSTFSAPAVTQCEEQDLKLNFIYTAAVMSLGVSTLAWGFMVDYLGPRQLLPLASAMFSIGSLLFAFSNTESFDVYAIGFVGIASGGCGIFYALLRLSELYGSLRVTVLGIYSVAFDASCIVFPIFGLINRLAGLSMRNFFIGYAAIGLLSLLCAVLWPLALSHTKEAKQEEDDESKPSSKESLPLLRGGDNDDDDALIKPQPRVPMSERSFKEQFLSLDYWIFCLYTNLSVLWLNMYVGTIPVQLEHMTDDRATVDFYVEVFAWTLPAVFVISPLIGWSVDKAGSTGAVISAHVGALLFAGCKLVPVLEVQFATFAIVSVYRAYFYTAMIAVLIEMYGYSNFGKLWGCCCFIGGWMNYLQQPLLAMAYELGSFAYVDMAQLACTLALSFYPVFLVWRLPRLT